MQLIKLPLHVDLQLLKLGILYSQSLEKNPERNLSRFAHVQSRWRLTTEANYSGSTVKRLHSFFRLIWNRV